MTEPVTTSTNTASVLDRTICLSVEFSRFGNRKKASTGAVSVDADKALLSLSKKLMQSAEFDAIAKVDRKVRKAIKLIAVPSPLGASTYLIPTGLIEEIDATLTELRAERETAVDAFIVAYPAAIDAMCPTADDTDKALGVLFSRSDYPTVSDMRSRFAFDWKWVDFGVPGRLKAINPKIWEAERSKAETNLREGTDVIRTALRAGWANLCQAMAEMLAPETNGKKKRVTAAMVENLNAFMRTLDLRNVTNDDELAAMVSRAKAFMKGVDPKTLRDDDLIRRSTAEAFGAQISELKALGVMIEERGARSIELDDDDAE